MLRVQIGLLWVLVQIDFAKPVIDNTTTDWFALQGREENGWTSIQFKRLLDTCDTMDVPIKVRRNVLILYVIYLF
jgi:hypothetical protein